MSTCVVIKEYPDGHRLYRLLQATPRELERVRHNWTRIIPIPNIHSGIMILAKASIINRRVMPKPKREIAQGPHRKSEKRQRKSIDIYQHLVAAGQRAVGRNAPCRR
jgi:hypothetical protein